MKKGMFDIPEFYYSRRTNGLYNSYSVL